MGEFPRCLPSLGPLVKYDEHKGATDNHKYREAVHRVLTLCPFNPKERITSLRK